MKFRFLLTLLLLVLSSALRAKEGMWIPTLLQACESDMQSMGLKLSAEDIYSVNRSSLKDAIVHFGGGCTASTISKEGLIITNHHCGYSQIQSHSSVEKDYLTNGFWAMKRSDELPNAGLTATFILRIEDVTARVMAGVLPGMGPRERQQVIDANRLTVEQEIEKANGIIGLVRPFSFGTQYFLMVTQTFNDVRLVGAPPSGIGKFGADPDNWVWPRHTGDFALFRIYADKDNQPADYSADNVPYKPRHHLPISLDGVKEGDFTMVFGFPGRTDSYLTAEVMDFVVNKSTPLRITMRAKSLSVIDAARLSSDRLRIAYAAKQSSISNAHKKWIGQNMGLERYGAMEKKRATETEINAWAAAKGTPEDRTLIKRIGERHREMQPLQLANDLYVEYLFYGADLLSFARRFQNFVENFDKLAKEGKEKAEAQKLLAGIPGFWKNYDRDVDRKIFENLSEMFDKNCPQVHLPEVWKTFMARHKGNYAAATAAVFDKTLLLQTAKLEKLLSKPNTKAAAALKKDPAYMLAVALFDNFFKTLRPALGPAAEEYELLMADYIGLMQRVWPDKYLRPDANSTLRLTYGKAEGSAPRDGITYNTFTTAEGILQKYIPGDPDYDVPADFIALLRKGDWGIYGSEGQLPVCFLGSNHTTGGNSGSPTLNGYGHFIGINFDRTWESTMSDIMFDPDLCRNIMTDARYILFVIDKYARATHLVDEMTLTKRGETGSEGD